MKFLMRHEVRRGGRREFSMLPLLPLWSLAVDFLAISDLHDQDNQSLVLNRIHDSIVAFADTVQIFFAGEFLDTMGAWILT